MTRNTPTGHDPSELGELERGILSIVWRKSSITAEQVRDVVQKWFDKNRSVTGYLIKDATPKHVEKRS